MNTTSKKRKPKPPMRHCMNSKCRFGQPPLLLKQKRFCSHQCVAESTKCRKPTAEAVQLFDLRQDKPRATLAELGNALGLTPSQVKHRLYHTKSSPWYTPPSEGELKRRETDKELRRNQKGFVLTARSAEASLAPKFFAKPRKPLVYPAERIRWCQYAAGELYTQCMDRAMNGSDYCLRHHRKMKHDNANSAV